MENVAAGSSVELNDSDDAFVFQSPRQKRKLDLKTNTPRAKRRKVTKTQVSSNNHSKKALKLTTHGSKKNISTAAGHSSTGQTSPAGKDMIDSPKKESQVDNGNEADKNKGTLDSPVEIISEVGKKIDEQNYKIDNSASQGKCIKLICPLCHKVFEKHAVHVSHMKQCAKKKNISTAELLRRIDLFKSGESSEPLQDTNFPREKKESTYELALATALTLSLEENDRAGSSIAVDRKVLDAQRTTLERFGFTSSVPNTGVRRRKVRRVGTPVLQTRTAEERMRLLTEKAAVILLDQAEPTEIVETKLKPACENSQVTSQFPYITQDKKLWNLGEEEKPGPWYLDELKGFISPEKCSLKSVEEPEAEPESEDKVAESKNLSSDENKVEECKPDESCSLQNDWARLVGKSDWSDAAIETLDDSVHVHTLVLRVRCPGVELSDFYNECQIVTSSTLLSVLRFIYAGTFEKTDDCDIKDALRIATVLGRKDLLEIIEAAKDSSSEDLIPSSLSPKDNEFKGGFERNMHNNPHIEKEEKPNSLPASEELPDTEPVADDQQTEEENENIIDLTESAENSENASDSDSPERSYLKIMRQSEYAAFCGNEQPELSERSTGAAKIEKFLEQQHSSQSYKDGPDREERLCDLSKSSEDDLFAEPRAVEVESFDPEMTIVPKSPNTNTSANINVSNVPSTDDIRILTMPPKSPAEVITVSSDSETNGQLTDDDETQLPRPSTPISDSQSLIAATSTPVAAQAPVSVTLEPCIFWDPEDNDARIDYYKTPMEEPSQSLTAIRSPRTPRRMDVVGSFTPTSSKANPRVSPPSTPTGVSFRDIDAWSELPDGKKRRSVVHNRHVRKSVKALSNRRRQSSCRPKFSEPSRTDNLLSESVINALDESRNGDGQAIEKPNLAPLTPSVVGRAFVEVTPKMTPSMKMLDNPTPRPNFSAMKTGSLKKHLQKFGLKKSLGKVKAKKILKHFFDELHPIINSQTGKVVKFLPEAEEERGRKVKKREKTARRGGKTASRSRKPENGSHRKTKTTALGQPSDFIANTGSSLNANESDTSDSGSEMESEYADFYDAEDEILTQGAGPTRPVSEAVTAFFESHPELYTKVLCYEPLWIEKFRREINDYFSSKYKLKDIMDYLDSQSVAFRSETQVANAKKVNDRRKNRRAKKQQKSS